MLIGLKLLDTKAVSSFGRSSASTVCEPNVSKAVPKSASVIGGLQDKNWLLLACVDRWDTVFEG